MMRLVQLDTCESTNDEAWKYLPTPTLVVTRHQTRGRGRQGRRWQDYEGNIMASLAFVPQEGLQRHMSWLPLAAGVAVADAIQLSAQSQEGFHDLRLKWPNDVMWADSKMGGILCESRVAGDKISGVVIGLGLNVKTAPVVEGMTTASLADHVKLVEGINGHILQRWSERVLFWASSLAQNRFGELRHAWLSHAKLDRFPEFSVHDAKGESIRLQAIDLDDLGRLKARSGSKIICLDQP